MRYWLNKVVTLIMVLAILTPTLPLFPGAYQVAYADVTGVTCIPTPSTANSAAQYTVQFINHSALYGSNSTITVTFPAGTIVPGNISKDLVMVSSYGGNFTGTLESNPVVEGQQVTMYVPSAAAGNGGIIEVSTSIAVVFSQAAGITNPSTGGVYTVSVSTSAEPVPVASAQYRIQSITINPTSGPAGIIANVYGEGFAAFSAVTSITIGGIDVTPPGYWTDSIGRFSVSVTIPGVSEGPQPVIATVAGQSASTSFNVGVVTFPDPNLEAAIRTAISKPTGDIYASDLLPLTSLNASNGNITNLTGLEYCVNLTQLYLNGNQIGNITPLSGLVNLLYLYLYSNQISDISPLNGLTNLTGLSLYSNQISDISPLAGLTKLTTLALGVNQISNISPLTGLANLTYLYLSSNQISDISPLTGLANLTSLQLQYNQISDITPLTGLTNLTKLYLYNNQIGNITPLTGLTNLTELRLYNNQISDIEPLVSNPGFSSGDTIYLQGNPLNSNSVNTCIPTLQGRGVTVYWDTVNHSPNQPANTSPTNAATDINLTPTLTSSAFSDPDGGDTHAASQWQITTTAGNYTSPVFDSGNDTVNLVSITVYSALSYSTTYYWHVRHEDNRGDWSAWSTETSFTTSGYTLTISSTDGGNVTVPGEGTFSQATGAVVNLLAMPDLCYVFVNWTGDVVTVGNVTAAATTITMNGNYSITANFEPNMPVATASSNSPVCEGSSITLTGGPDGMTTHTWTGPNGFTSDEQSPTIENATLAMSGDYTLTITNANGCSDSATTEVTVNSPPDCTFTISNGGIGNITPGWTGDISVPYAGTGATYDWTVSGGTLNSGAGTTSINWTAPVSGDWSIGVIVTDAYGCSCNNGIAGPLDSYGSISGYVYEEDGATTIGGATVQVWNYAQQAPLQAPAVSVANTNPDGSYTMANLPAGDYRVMAWAPHHAAEFHSETFVWDQAERITVSGGQQVSPINFTLDPGGNISGNITNTTGQPLAGVSVIAFFADGSPGFMATTTDASGNYVLIGLPFDREYIVQSPAPLRLGAGDDHYLTQFWQARATREEAEPILVSATTPDVTGINFALDQGGSISGYVYDSDTSQPIEGASVAVFQYNEPLIFLYHQVAITDASGHYTLEGIPAGNYKLRALASDYIKIYYDGHTIDDEANSINVAAGSSQSFDFNLTSGAGSISGMVQFKPGIPADNARILVYTLTGSLVNGGFSDTTGTYKIENLAPGDYKVRAIANGFEKWWEDKPNLNSADTVNVISPETGGIDFTMGFAATVHAGLNVTVNEGQTVHFSGAFTDPDPEIHSLVWNFGDGQPAISGTDAPTHIYADNGIYTVTFTVTGDTDGRMSSGNLTVTVSNVAPVVDAGADIVADEGETINLMVAFSDPGTSDTHTATVNWGTGDEPATVTEANGNGTVTSSHSYASGGIYTVTIKVTDKDGASTEGQLHVYVPIGISVSVQPGQVPIDTSSLYVALKDLPLTSIPIEEIPWNKIQLPDIALNESPLQGIPLQGIPLQGITWQKILENSKFDPAPGDGDPSNIPLQGITLKDLVINGIPLQGITLEQILLAGIPLQGISLEASPLQGIPLQGIPLQGITWESILKDTPLQGIPLQGITLQDLVVEGIPLQGIPLQGIDILNSLLKSVPLQGIPLQGITWESVLMYTPLQGIPLQGITLGDLVLNNVPLQGITLENILVGLPLQGIPLQGIPLQGIPLQGIPLQGICLADLVLNDIPLQGISLQNIDILNSSIQHLPLQGIPLQGITWESILIGTPLQGIPLQGITLGDLALNNVPLQGIPLQGIDILNSPLQGIPLQGIPLQGITWESILMGTPLQGSPLHGSTAQGVSVNGTPLQGIKLGSISTDTDFWAKRVPNWSTYDDDFPLGTTSLGNLSTATGKLKDVPLQGIPLQGIPLQGIPLQGINVLGTPLQGIPLTNIPLQGITWQSILAGTPLQGIPLEELTLGDVVMIDAPLQGIPLQGISLQDIVLAGISLPSISIGASPIQDLPLQGIPLQGITWASILVSTPLQGIPLQGITLQDLVINGIPLQGIPLQGIDILNSSLRYVPLQGIPLQGITWESVLMYTPLQGIPLQGITLGDLVLNNVPLQGIPLQGITWKSILMGTPLQGIPLQGITLGDLALSNVPLQGIPLQGIDILNSPLQGIPLQGIPLLQGITWEDVLSGTSLEGKSLDSITMGDLVRNHVPLQGISLQEIDILNSPLQGIPLQGITLENILVGLPLQGIPLQGIYAWQSILVGTPLQGIPLQGITLGNLTLSNVPLQGIPLQGIKILGTPLQGIPLQGIPLQGITWQQVLEGSALDPNPIDGNSSDITLEGITLGNLTLSNVPLQGITLQRIDIWNSPLKDIPLQGIPLQGIPLQGIKILGTPLQGIPLQGIPLQGITWETLLAGTPLQGIPLNELTLGDLAMATAPLQGISLGDLPLQGIPLQGIPLQGIGIKILGTPLQGIPLQGIPLQGITWESRLMGTPLQGIPLGNITLGDLVLNSVPLQGITVQDLSNGGVGLQDIPLQGITILGTPLQGITLEDINSTPGYWDTILQGTIFEGQNPSTITLGDIAEIDHVLEQVTLADAMAAFVSVQNLLILGTALENVKLSDITADWASLLQGTIFEGKVDTTLGDLVMAGVVLQNLSLWDAITALIPLKEIPWESIPLEDLPICELLESQIAVTYTIVVANYSPNPAEGVIITHTLPEGFQYVSGSTSGNITSNPLVTGGNLTWGPFNVEQGTRPTLSFKAIPALSRGNHFSSVSATTTNGVVIPPVTNVARVTVGDSFEPNDRWEDAEVIQGDRLYISHISSETDVDWFKIPIPSQKGTMVTVHLSHLPADYDLNLYADAQEVQAAVNTQSIPLQDIPMSDIESTDIPPEDTPVSDSPLSDSASEDMSSLVVASLDPASPASIYLKDISAERGTEDEAAGDRVVNDTGYYYIRVLGYGGSQVPNFSDQPYVLRVKVDPPPEQFHSSRSLPDDGSAGTTYESDTPEFQTLIVMNQKRMQQYYGVDRVSDMQAKLIEFASRDDVRGVIVPVEQYPAVQNAYNAWDAETGDPDNANKLAVEIRSVIRSWLTNHPSIQYVMVIGSDEIIPFYRIPDETYLSNESTYVPRFYPDMPDSALKAALTQGYILSDDFYVDMEPIAWKGRELYIPDYAIGRLVESPQEIVGVLDQYIANGGKLEPQTALVTGYDFLSDGASAVAEALKQQGISAPSEIINDSWSAGEFDQLFIDTSPGFDLNSVNAHADHWQLQAADGSLFQSSEVQYSTLEGKLIFSMGCHAGLSVDDSVWQVGVDGSLDFPQAFARKAAWYVGNTGYGYGDSVTMALTEKLMDNFAIELGTQGSVGEALVKAKQLYYKNMGIYGFFDEKSLTQSTLYGPPMYRVIMPAPAPPQDDYAGIDPIIEVNQYVGSEIAGNISWSTDLVKVSTDKGEFYAADGNKTQFVQYRPVQPRTSQDISLPDVIAHGVLFREGTYEDHLEFDPVISRPLTIGDSDQYEPQFINEEWFPTRLQTIMSLQTKDNVSQILVVMPAQFITTSADVSVKGTERLYTGLKYDVYYSTSADYTPPAIERVDIGSGGIVSVVANDNNDPMITDDGIIEEVMVTWTAVGSNTWQTIGLQYDSMSGKWTGSLAELSGSTIDFIIQAVDMAGNVGLSTKKGLLYNWNNPVPMVNAGSDQNVAEGQTVQFSGSFTDNDYDTHTIEWNFGDAHTASGTLQPTHQYGDDGSYMVTLTVVDDDGGVGVDTLTVTVTNVVPMVYAGRDQNVAEGKTVQFSGSFTDTDYDTHTVEWDFGDEHTASGTLQPTHRYEDDESYIVTLTVVDDDGGAGVDTLTLAVTNVAPAVYAGPDQTVDVGNTVTFAGSFSDPGLADTHTITWDFGDSIGSATGSLTPTYTYATVGTYTVTLTVTDDDGGVGVDTLTVTVLTLHNTQTGSNVSVELVDPSTGIPVTLTFAQVNVAGDTAVSTSDSGPFIPTQLKLGNPPVYFDFTTDAQYQGSITICIDYTNMSFGKEDNLELRHWDGNGWADVTTELTTESDKICGTVSTLSPFAITEPNESPVAKIYVNTYVTPLGTAFTFDGGNSFDPDGSIAEYSWAFDDGTNGSGMPIVHGYNAVGVYNVTLTVTDDTGAEGSETIIVVVYDPNGGFVTGGGWINSPRGAYAPNPTLIGKATFGFVSKYNKGATVPTGQTEFQFHVANMNFHSERYDWLVIAGARAQYKGTGTINNGIKEYRFILTAIDGQIKGGGGVDRFRIKIWDKATGEIIYDNQLGATDTADPTTAIAGGSIVIHK